MTCTHACNVHYFSDITNSSYMVIIVVQILWCGGEFQYTSLSALVPTLKNLIVPEDNAPFYTSYLDLLAHICKTSTFNGYL